MQMSQQQLEIAGNMQTMQAENEAMNSIMEQFNDEAQTMQETMKNQPLGLVQMEVRLEALRTTTESIMAEVTSKNEHTESMITKFNDASSSAFDMLRQNYGGIEGSMNDRINSVESQLCPRESSRT